MFNGIQAAASGMEAALRAHETLSHNLAHASVPGFRRTVIPFSVLEGAAAGDRKALDTVGVTPEAPVVDFTPGPIEQTGNPLDVAIDGDGFFTIDGPSGPLYTRSGTFHLDASGQLVNSDGLPVRGEQGAITLPADATASQLQIAPDGRVLIGQEELGRLALVEFDDPETLTSVGATLFQASPTATSRASTATLIQGAREMSNVNAVSELVALITAQRHYEAAQRAMSAIDRTAQKRIETG